MVIDNWYYLDGMHLQKCKSKLIANLKEEQNLFKAYN